MIEAIRPMKKTIKLGLSQHRLKISFNYIQKTTFILMNSEFLVSKKNKALLNIMVYKSEQMVLHFSYL